MMTDQSRPLTSQLLPHDQLAPLLAGYRQSLARRRFHLAIFAAVMVLLTLVSASVAEINPTTFFTKIGGFTSYFTRLAHLDNGALVWSDPVEWFWGWKRWLRLLGETILIGYVGTFLAAIVAVLLSFVGATNLNKNVISRTFVKRFFEFCRTVPELVFALIFVVAYGVGPLPGILAIIIHTVGALGKLFTELVENIEMGPIEGLAASGGGSVAIARFGALPQVLPGFLSYTLLRFEMNVRSATIMGFVGAGGIGDELMLSIRRFYYADVSAILVIVLVTVFMIDILTSKLRYHLQGNLGK
jgi:phosphonate transport system permease protein